MTPGSKPVRKQGPQSHSNKELDSASESLEVGSVPEVSGESLNPPDTLF